MAQPRADKPSKKVIRIVQTGSVAGCIEAHRRVIKGLGLSRPGRSVVREDTPSIRGMCAKVPYLVRIEEVPS